MTVQFSIAQTSPLLKYLPANSNMVMFINPGKLAAKVPGDVFRNSALFREMTAHSPNNEMEAFFKNPAMSGLNLFSDMILVSHGAVDNGEQPGVAMFGLLSGKQTFDSLIRAMSGPDTKIQQKGNLNYYITGEKGMALAWNDEAFALTGNKDSKKELQQLFEDTTDTRDFEIRMKEIKKAQHDKLVSQCLSVLQPQPDNSSFYAAITAVQQEAGDIRIWSNGKTRNMDKMEKMPPVVKELLENMYRMNKGEVTSIVNFEKGKIAGITRTIPGPEKQAILAKYPVESLPVSMYRHLPKGNTLLMIMTASNPDKSKEMMQLLGLNKYADSLKQLLKMDFSKLGKIFGNKMMITLMEVTPEEDMDGSGSPLENLGLFISMPVKDKVAAGDMKAKMDHLIDSLAETEKGGKILSMVRPVFLFDDSLAVFSIRPDHAAAFLTTNNELPAGMKDNQPGTMLMSFNIKAFINLLAGMSGGKQPLPEEARAVFEKFEDMQFGNDGFVNGVQYGHMEFRFSDPEKNALQQLFEAADLAAQSAKKEKQAVKDAEDIEMPPPPVEEPVQKKTKSPSRKKG